MIIFSPGPANISERVRKALSGPDICHRDKEFSDILTDVRRMVMEVLEVGKGYKSILLGGSGTLAIESSIASLGGYGKKILVISNGIYGERAADIARFYGVGVDEIKLEWGKLPDMNKVEERLAGALYGAVYIVHHETTTGLLNPLGEIAAIARKKGKMVMVDGVSSIAGETLKPADWGIDAISGSANKCIRGVPGISFVVASDRFLSTVKKCRSRAYYADLKNHLKAEDSGAPLFTPPVQVFYAFREALEELLAEGVQARIGNYDSIAKMLRNGLKGLKMQFYIPEETMSNTMTSVCMPKGCDYGTLHRLCKEKGYVIYASQGVLADSTFRLGTVGLISKKDIDGFIDCLCGILKEKNVK